MTSNYHRSIQHRTSKQWLLRGLVLMVGLLVLDGCKASQPAPPVAVAVAQDAVTASADPEEARMWMTVGERRFAVTLADTDAARAFAAQLPLTLDMTELNGNEKHTELPAALPTDATRPGAIHNGDLMLYGASTLVVFYEAFRSSYSYTRIGRVDDPDGLSQAFGRREVRIAFTRD